MLQDQSFWAKSLDRPASNFCLQLRGCVECQAFGRVIDDPPCDACSFNITFMEAGLVSRDIFVDEPCVYKNQGEAGKSAFLFRTSVRQLCQSMLTIVGYLSCFRRYSYRYSMYLVLKHYKTLFGCMVSGSCSVVRRPLCRGLPELQNYGRTINLQICSAICKYISKY